jgi:hypothetical protein
MSRPLSDDTYDLIAAVLLEEAKRLSEPPQHEGEAAS